MTEHYTCYHGTQQLHQYAPETGCPTPYRQVRPARGSRRPLSALGPEAAARLKCAVLLVEKFERDNND